MVHACEHALFSLGFSRKFPTKIVDGDTLTHPGMDVGPLLGGRMEIDFLAGLIAGLSTSAHCLAMCGGIAAVIALGAGALQSLARSLWLRLVAGGALFALAIWTVLTPGMHAL